MIYLPLPFLSQRLGGPVVAAIPPVFERDPQPPPPPETLILRMQAPPGDVLGTMPKPLRDLDDYDRVSMSAEDRQADAVAWETWIDHVVRSAASAVGMSTDDVADLGPDRDVLAGALLRAWAWIPDAVGAFAMPGDAYQEVLRVIATTTHRLPSELRKLPLDELAFNYRVLAPAMATGDRP